MHPEVFENCSTILIDIAGTVGSINFTKETLFAFAKKNIEEYLNAKWEDEEVKKLMAELKGDGEELADVTKAVERFNALTDENSVNTGLKTLQGLLYKQGYENGELKAHVFDDIKSALEEWSKHRKICVYSTGAQEAQKQYFSHSTAGDLSSFIANYFDQTIGKKTASESYEGIAKSLEVKTQEIVFLSDDIEEIKAAAQAGCAGVLVTREGNADVADADKKDRIVISTFADLPLLSAKRKSEEEVSAEEPPAKVAKIESEAEPEETKKAEKTESMEVDTSEPSTTEPTPAEAEPAKEKTETVKDAKEAEAAPAAEVKTDETEVTTTDVAPDTTDKAEAMEAEKTDASDATVAPAEKVEAATPVEESVKTTDDTTDTKEATETTETTVTETCESETKEAEKTKVAEEEKPAPAAEEPEMPSATATIPEPAPTPASEEAKTEVTENGKENGSEPAKAANGDAVDEKENKRDIANGTAEAEKNGDAETLDEVKVKKIDDSPETAAPVTVET